MNLDDFQKKLEETSKTDKHSMSISISLETLGAILTILFIILKLTGVIAISWFWVFFPLWIVPAAALGIILLVVLIALPFLFIAASRNE